LLQLSIDGFYLSLILVYFFSAVFVAIGLYQWKHAVVSIHRFHTIRVGWGILWRLFCIICLAFSVLLTWTFGRSNTFIAGILVNDSVDYSNRGWSDAFDEMNAHIAKSYAFAKWKSIDWDSLNKEFKPQIIAAEKAADKAAYYLTLRKYVYSLPDGHCFLEGDDLGQINSAIGGGFGFAVIQLDDGRVIAYIVEKTGPADQKGMAWGAEILSWNGQPILMALDHVSTLWSPSPLATQEGKHIAKLNFLTRAPVGTTVSVTFCNPDDATIKDISLTAVADNMRLYIKDAMMGLSGHKIKDSDQAVESRILPNGYGYLAIRTESPSLSDLNPVGTVRKAIADFKAAKVSGVVIDVRANGGGIEEMTRMMMAHFIMKSLFYKQLAFTDETGRLRHFSDISIEPVAVNYAGPTAMLISNQTISAGEGFPLVMKSLNRGPVVGFYGTYGSFGEAAGRIRLPGNYAVIYPNGASLDKDGKIQIDSNNLMQGGISPDVRIPIDMEALKAICVDHRDYALEAAIAAMNAAPKK